MPKQLHSIFLPTALGTILEWYDFTLFAYLAPVLSALFFPKQNHIVALMLTYSILAVGYFVRPIGAMLLGHFGDRTSRKQVLIISIVCMGIATGLMGMLPTYQSVGLAAPLLLIAMRMLQGLSVGAESTGATLFAIESAPDRPRGLTGALLWSTVGIGMLLGLGTCTLATELFTHDVLYSWGWRIPFLFGIVTAIVGYFIRKNAPEPASFVKLQQRAQRPLLEIFTQHRATLIKIMCLYALSAMITYQVFVFMPTYMVEIINLPARQSQLLCTLALALDTALVPLTGYLSDKIGRRRTLGLGALGLLTLSYYFYALIASGTTYQLICALCGFSILAALFQGPLSATCIELLPTRVRYSGAALGYNLSYSIVGGTAPLLATFLVRSTGHATAPAGYIMLGAVIALITLRYMPEMAFKPLR